VKINVADQDNLRWAVEKGVRAIPAVSVYKDGVLVDSWAKALSPDEVIKRLSTFN
jgi:thioredoxin-like negative regulator of GroEL